MWTHFFDIHSSGYCKVSPYENIYIEAPEDEAKLVFKNRFGRDPEKSTCSCCGQDYSIDSNESLDDLSIFDRKYRDILNPNVDTYGNRNPISLESYEGCRDVLIIHSQNIKDEERLIQHNI